GIHAKGRPFLERRVEAAGREQQERHAAPAHFVMRGHAVDDCVCQATSCQDVRAAGGAPLIWRPARTSSHNALIAVSAASATFAYRSDASPTADARYPIAFTSARTRPSSQGPPPKPPMTGMLTAATTAGPATGPEYL